MSRHLHRSALIALATMLAGLAATPALAQGSSLPTAGSAPAGQEELAATVLSRGGFSLAGVSGTSCVSATFCFAVGTGTVLHGRTSLTGNTGLIWRYDGRSWRLSARVPVRQSSLVSISCTSRSFCLAVGRAGNPNGEAFALRWNGRSWSRVHAASPSSSGNGDTLGSVDCLSRTDCWAVGGINLGEAAGGPGNDLVEHWGGRAFKQAAAPRSGNSLFEIACASAHECWAAGYPQGSTASSNEVDRFNGRAWRIVRLPVSLSGGTSGISCNTPATCWIIGMQNAGGLRPASLHLRGRAWKQVPVPSPRYPDVTLQGLGCASAGDCWTVGSNMLVGPGISHPSRHTSFAEQWDGSSWMIAKVTGPSAARDGLLDTVSCAAPDFCAAGGQASNGGPLLAVSRPVG